MIELKNISKIYMIDKKPFYALKEISLSVSKGEMIAIMGKSGAGKSTLLHILGCLDNYSQGTYYFDGCDIAELSAAQNARLRNKYIGFVLQDYSLLNHKTALYNVMSPMFFNDTPYLKMKPKALKALERAGILDQANKNIVDMSGGQRQRVAIARAIVNDCKLILADEPTGNLDSLTSNEIMNLFCSLNSEGKTVIIVTHDDNISSYCNRKIIISDGKIIS